ncbi:hypothetical protein [Paenibacillus wynnii]|uniref:Uncharacterized protein n=1 Tax=Paenibacillus wynnii TaxID=268407 RepID=A0A098M2J8_9BACL|nr:hypothetical protein [Paenibacillus wynnii]KGE16604.1 hypothetical protein PWYN_17980 [Paenibacillus wynnii]
MLTNPGTFFVEGLGLLSFFFWLVTVGMGLCAFVLFVKMALRAIAALDLYIYAKNREIRTHYESPKPGD